MFTKPQNIDRAFRSIRNFCMLVIVACVLICGMVAFHCFQAVYRAQSRIYILSNGKALEVFAADRKDNIPVEARDHVKSFHQLFFSLSPDEKAIESNITKALYLADQSAKRQYDDLKEGNYYSNIISGNVTQEVRVDSVVVDVNTYPIVFRCFAQLLITRPSAIVTRSLITEGQLRNLTRSDNNPHGFLIEKWNVLENKDLTMTRR